MVSLVSRWDDYIYLFVPASTCTIAGLFILFCVITRQVTRRGRNAKTDPAASLSAINFGKTVHSPRALGGSGAQGTRTLADDGAAADEVHVDGPAPDRDVGTAVPGVGTGDERGLERQMLSKSSLSKSSVSSTAELWTRDVGESEEDDDTPVSDVLSTTGMKVALGQLRGSDSWRRVVPV